MHKKDFIKQLICKEKIVPLYYDDNAELSIAVLKVLYEAGIRLVEYTNRGAHALDNFMAIRKIVNNEMPGLQLGAGTVKTAVDAQLFITAGAGDIDALVQPLKAIIEK